MADQWDGNVRVWEAAPGRYHWSTTWLGMEIGHGSVRFHPEARASEQLAAKQQAYDEGAAALIRATFEARVSSDLVGIQEIADRLGVHRLTVDTWRARRHTLKDPAWRMPEPDMIVSGRPLWWWSKTIDPWAHVTGRLPEIEQPETENLS